MRLLPLNLPRFVAPVPIAVSPRQGSSRLGHHQTRGVVSSSRFAPKSPIIRLRIRSRTSSDTGVSSSSFFKRSCSTRPRVASSRVNTRSLSRPAAYLAIARSCGSKHRPRTPSVSPSGRLTKRAFHPFGSTAVLSSTGLDPRSSRIARESANPGRSHSTTPIATGPASQSDLP